jgi:hypothetical protein
MDGFLQKGVLRWLKNKGGDREGRPFIKYPVVARVVVIPAIPAPGRLRQEDHKFKANMGYIERPCFEKKNFKYPEISSEAKTT